MKLFHKFSNLVSYKSIFWTIFSEIYNKIFEVEYSDRFESFEKAMEYAENSGMSHMLYFLDDINLKLVSLLDDMGGYTLDVTVDDLKKVLSQNA